ncbi:copper transporter [Nonomuraea sp. NPDC050478]|uniref:copper transporter n=1 Tax=Nonomuraea sp. NPDC050478 TaxID=3364365 RepID=UPI0037AF8F0E
MIDFRYHLVSIVAIFLALAVGIVLGTNLLQDPAIKTANEMTRQLTQTNEGLRGELDVMKGREQVHQEFITTLTPQLVQGGLAGEQVLLVEAPGASSTYRELTEQVLAEAGAKVTGRLLLLDKFFDPKSAGVLDGLVNQLKPAEMAFADTATVHDKAATLLAATLMTADPALAGTPNEATSAVVDGLQTGGFIDVDFIDDNDEPLNRATLAVLYSPDAPYEGDNAESQAAALVSVAGGIDAGGKGAVMAGAAATSAAPGGAITALRDDSETAKRVSSVDNVDMPEGQVVIVYALREQATGGVGQYGTGAGATAFQPVTPSPAPSSTESGS